MNEFELTKSNVKRIKAGRRVSSIDDYSLSTSLLIFLFTQASLYSDDTLIQFETLILVTHFDNFSEGIMGKKSVENNDTDKKLLSDAGPDPTAPIIRRGILTSFLSGKPMEIPERDIVRNTSTC